MGQQVYKKVELVGTSAVSISEAINTAIASASDSMTGISWFEVQEIRGHVADGKVSEYQVVLKIGLRLND